jgi:3-deoxy-D-manno-octulosonate 8-phosphate phosphatase (KDO 8-P phosphatase)
MREKLEKLKMIILDVDGTMTDGGVYIDQDGRQIKKFDARDGMAIQLIQKNNLKVGIISHSKSAGMVLTRADMLDIEYCYVGSDPKTEVLKRWMEDLKYDLSEICYIGDDVNDLEIMKLVGLAICPSDAAIEIAEISHYQLSRKGGEACIREFYDSMLKPTFVKKDND